MAIEFSKTLRGEIRDAIEACEKEKAEFAKTIEARGYEVAHELLLASRRAKLAEEAFEESKNIVQRAKVLLVEKDDELRAIELLAGNVPFVDRDHNEILTRGERAYIAAAAPQDRARMANALVVERGKVDRAHAIALFAIGWAVAKDRFGMFPTPASVADRDELMRRHPLMTSERFERAAIVLVSPDDLGLFVDHAIEWVSSPESAQRNKMARDLLGMVREQLGDVDFKAALADVLAPSVVAKACDGESPEPEKAVAVGYAKKG